MRLSGSTEFIADRDRVWAVLVDPTRAGACAPVPVTRVDDTHFRSQARLGSGILSATFSMEVELQVLEPNRRARLVGHGGGSGTTVAVDTSFDISDGSMAGAVRVDWTAELTLEGMFAGAGARIIEQRAPDAVRTLIECLHREVEQEAA